MVIVSLVKTDPFLDEYLEPVLFDKEPVSGRKAAKPYLDCLDTCNVYLLMINREYEDVTGLCKLATIDEIREQDYSLNPGRYVGVVIEEDGKTEEEFIEEMLDMDQELNKLNRETRKLEKIIHHNILELRGEI